MPAVVLVGLVLLLLLQTAACTAAAQQGSRKELHPVQHPLLLTEALDQPRPLPQLLEGNASRSCGRSGWERTAVAAAADFATPPLPRSPAAPLPQCSVQEAEKGLAAHVTIQRWLDEYFRSSASELSSSRLQAELLVAGSAGLMPVTEARELAAEGVGSRAASGSDRLAGMGRAAPHDSSCDAACRRAEAKLVLLSLPASRRALSSGGSRQWQQQAQQLEWLPFLEDRRRWAAVAPSAQGHKGGSSGNSTCCLLQPGEPPPPKDFLLVAAVGNNLSALNRWDGAGASRRDTCADAWCCCSSRWLSAPGSATFDLVVLHYGGGGGGGEAAAFSCPHCRAVLHGAGPKWRLMWQLTQHPAWPALVAGKAALMVPDDDLIIDTCAINRWGWGEAQPCGASERSRQTRSRLMHTADAPLQSL